MERLTFTYSRALLVMGVSRFAWWIGSFTQGRLATPENNTRVIAIGAMIVTLALLLLPLTVLTSLLIWTAAIFVGIAEIGLGLALPAVGVQTFRQSRVDRQGFNSSSLQIVEVALGVVLAAGLSVLTTALPEEKVLAAFSMYVLILGWDVVPAILLEITPNL